MPSDSGFPGLFSRSVTLTELRIAMARGLYGGDHSASLTAEEQQRIDGGEPYCFRCGKPASSFPEYGLLEEDGTETDRAQYACEEEGTYNPATNRFACDACYIAIGMPVGEPGNDYGWKAP